MRDKHKKFTRAPRFFYLNARLSERAFTFASQKKLPRWDLKKLSREENYVSESS
jgi:hypothetical protein